MFSTFDSTMIGMAVGFIIGLIFYHARIKSGSKVK